MKWIKEDNLYYDLHGNLLRKNQDHAPSLKVGDRFFDCANGRWAILTAIRNQEDSHGAPFEALYDGCAAFGPFIGHAMHCDIGEIISEVDHSYKEQ